MSRDGVSRGKTNNKNHHHKVFKKCACYFDSIPSNLQFYASDIKRICAYILRLKKFTSLLFLPHQTKDIHPGHSKYSMQKPWEERFNCSCSFHFHSSCLCLITIGLRKEGEWDHRDSQAISSSLSTQQPQAVTCWENQRAELWFTFKI